MPDGNGGFQPVPELLTTEEAIRFLRLDTIKTKNPQAALRRYRRMRYLHGVQVGKKVLYQIGELLKFVEKLKQQNPR